MATSAADGFHGWGVIALPGASYQYQEPPEDYRAPEIILAEAFQKDLGVKIDPQALRIFIRWRWDRVQKLAHKIHDAP